MHNHPHHEFRYDEQERKTRQDPTQILQAVGLKPGMVFVDIGSNDGFFTLPAAAIVGPSGKVYAVDISAPAIARLKEKFKTNGITNYVTQTAKAEETVFAEHMADLIFLGTVLHDFEDPTTVLANARRMLKKGGKLVNLDWQKKATAFGPPLDIRFSKDTASKLIQDSGFTVEECRDYDENYYVIDATAL